MNFLRRLPQDVLWGAKRGLLMGAIYSVIGALIRLARGPHLMDSYGGTFGGLEIAYLSSGLVAGVIGGLARPTLRWRWGALAVGAGSGLFAYRALQAVMAGPPSHWSTFDMVSWLLMGSAMGAWVGNTIWENLVYPTLPPPSAQPGPPQPRPPLGLWKP
jgi:hypothetical protein